jgi:hypothetical protein
MDASRLPNYEKTQQASASSMRRAARVTSKKRRKLGILHEARGCVSQAESQLSCAFAHFQSTKSGWNSL